MLERITLDEFVAAIAMPFNPAFGSPITLTRAEQLMAAVEAEAKKRDWAFNIAVVDLNGDLVAFKRMDGAQLASISISQHKARTAARYRRPTKVFEDAIQKAIGCSGGTGSQDVALHESAIGS